MKNNIWFKLSRSKYTVSCLFSLIGLMFFFVVTESIAADSTAQAPALSSSTSTQPAGAGQPAVTQSQSSTKSELPKPPTIASVEENALITVTALET